MSLRLLAPYFDAAMKKGAAPERLARGTGASVEELRNRRERIAWSAFLTFIDNVASVFDEDELVALGAELLDSPVHRALLVPGRLLFSLSDIYRWGAGPDGPLARLIVVHDMSVTQIDDATLVIESRMKAGYACSRAFWLLRLGFLQSVPRAFGLPPAKVTLNVTGWGARHEVVLPRETSLKMRLRRRASWLFAARDGAEELRRTNDELHARYVELQREVQARKAAEESVRSLNAELDARVRERTTELEEANAALRIFSAAVAHDLRAPLRAINGFATALREDHGDRLGVDATRQVDRIASGTLRMSALIDALLSLSRLDRVLVERERVDVSAIAREVVDGLRIAGPARSVDVEIEDDLTADADPVLVRALLENLIGNAWKFTRDRAPARISLARTATGAFCVRDNGAGFDMKHAGSLFSPFRRLHSARVFEGTGIGLAIVSRIVRRHGGTISADARPDEGASFSFTLRA